MIPYARQDIDADDIAAVNAVLQSDWLTQGPAIEHFEREMAAYCGAQYALAVSSATAALHLAVLASGFGAGDTLVTSPNTFVASANCALYAGGAADFADIDAQTFNLSPAALESRLDQLVRQGRRPRVVVPVHFGGEPCDMAAIGALAKARGLFVIEDASHAVGGSYQGGKIGNCAHSDITVLSFHPVKIITTAEGGMLLTNNADLYEKLKMLRSHGITRDADKLEHPAHGPWYYEQQMLGFNYRMTDLHAALGTSQLKRIDAFVRRRAELAARYDAAFAELPLRHQKRGAAAQSANHLYVVRLDDAGRRRATFDALRARGVYANVHYVPVHLQPYYARMGFKAGDFPQAEAYYAGALTIPLFPRMSDAEQQTVIVAMRELLA
jgi:UDP-4-amino-4,6-dideoxy-N-acetyl-beta-L-altrosamine transaminase